MYKMWCMPTSRCYKGLTILFGIWAVALLLLGIMIPPIVRQHGVQPKGPDEAEWLVIQTRITTLLWCSYIMAAAFAGASLLSVAACLAYRTKERNSAESEPILMDEKDTDL